VYCRICFEIVKILLLAALSVESGHLKNWSKLRTGCYSVREGLFFVAGVFALAIIFLVVGLYLTTLYARNIQLTQLHLYEKEIAVGKRSWIWKTDIEAVFLWWHNSRQNKNSVLKLLLYLQADTYLVKDLFLINVENDTSHPNHEVTSNSSKFIPSIEHNRLYIAS